MTLSANEFLRRFLLHVLPGGFVRIRHYGFLANRSRSRLVTVARQLLDVAPARTLRSRFNGRRAYGLCPKCAAPMIIIERFVPGDVRLRAIYGDAYADTS